MACTAFISFLVDIRQFFSSLIAAEAVPGLYDGSSTDTPFKFTFSCNSNRASRAITCTSIVRDAPAAEPAQPRARARGRCSRLARAAAAAAACISLRWAALGAGGSQPQPQPQAEAASLNELKSIFFHKGNHGLSGAGPCYIHRPSFRQRPVAVRGWQRSAAIACSGRCRLIAASPVIEEFQCAKPPFPGRPSS